MLLPILSMLGCQCGQPALPSDSTPTVPTRPSPPPTETGEEPLCALEEVEPNNNESLANDLPLEAKACGHFNNVNGDADHWAFTVPVATWIGIQVDAEQQGSLANPAAIVVSDHGTFARTDDDDGGDVSLLLPLLAGNYNLQLIEQNLSGADDGRWFYNLQVSEQKAPRSWNRVIDEPADSENPVLAVHGDSLYGTIDSTTDEDWLQIEIPTGRHTLTVSTEAFGSGSPLNALIQLRDPAGNAPTCPSNADCRFERGLTGFENDPVARYASDGDETIYVRFRGEDSGGSPFHWYVLDITLESTE